MNQPPCPYWVIAIDPGTHDTGVALFKDGVFYDAFTLQARTAIRDADIRSFNIVSLLAERVWHLIYCQPCHVIHADLVYEDPTFMRRKDRDGTDMGIPIAQLFRFIGHLDQWGRSYNLQVFKYGVNAIKTGIAGRAGASKTEVETILRHEFNLHDANFTSHAFDAISVGHYHLIQLRIGAAIMKE